jgi:hypothetical protein
MRAVVFLMSNEPRAGATKPPGVSRKITAKRACASFAMRGAFLMRYRFAADAHVARRKAPAAIRRASRKA